MEPTYFTVLGLQLGSVSDVWVVVRVDGEALAAVRHNKNRGRVESPRHVRVPHVDLVLSSIFLLAREGPRLAAMSSASVGRAIAWTSRPTSCLASGCACGRVGLGATAAELASEARAWSPSRWSSTALTPLDKPADLYAPRSPLTVVGRALAPASPSRGDGPTGGKPGGGAGAGKWGGTASGGLKRVALE